MSAAPQTRIRRRVLVSGRVQGVAFRHYTREAADRAGVAGWARNLPDGRVEAVFEGPPEAVEALLAFCRSGPALADVSGVEAHEEQLQGEAAFQIRRD